MNDDEATEREFRRVADSIIDRANFHLDSAPKENVGMAMLYAAARFNAFVVSSHSSTRDQFDAERDQAVEFFSAEYLKMLQQNLDDYRQVYEDQETAQ